jgi:outer membrane protein assembly factor BamB
VIGSWQVPEADAAGGTSSFASTPILFYALIGHRVRQLVGVANRNGIYYAFDQNHLSAGPAWQTTIAVGGRTALQYVPGTASGQGSVAPSSWDGTRLYVAGGQTTIHGSSCKGSVRALSPASGQVIWEQCMQAGPVVGAPASCKGGVVVAAAGDLVVAMSSATGAVLYTYLDPELMPFGSGPSISHGWIYVGNVDGGMHAYQV